MTREAVSAAKPAVRAQAKTEKVHGAASAAVLKGLVYGAAVLTFAVLLFLIGYILVTGIPHLKPSLFQCDLHLGERLDDACHPHYG